MIRPGSGEATVEVAARAAADRQGRAWKTGTSVSTSGDNVLYAPLGERLAPLGAVAVAVLSQVLMHDRIVLGPLLLVPIIEVSLGVVLILGDGVLRAQRHRMGLVRYVLALVLACSATASAALLIHDVVHAKSVSVQQLLSEGVQIEVVLAVGFALLFWQLDRGGPNGRVQPDVERMSFWFTQDAIREYSDQFRQLAAALPRLPVSLDHQPPGVLTHRHHAAESHGEDAHGLGICTSRSPRWPSSSLERSTSSPDRPQPGLACLDRGPGSPSSKSPHGSW